MAVLAATAGGALGAPAAADGETPPGRVEFPTHCLPDAEGPTAARIEVDDPAPRAGDTVTVTYRLDRTPLPPPAEGALPAPTGRILLGGAQTGEVPVAAAGGSGGAVMKGSFVVTGGGPITLTPGGYALAGAACAAAGPSAPVAARLTVAPLPLMNLRGLALGASYGEPGARVRVTGAGFTPGAAVTVAGRAGAAGTADRAAATADRSGAFTAELVVADPGTTGVVAYEGAAWSAERGARPEAYTVVEPVPAVGSLTMTQAGAAITLGAVGYGGAAGAAGRIGTVTVVDTRGPGAGRWTLRGRLTGFTGADGAPVPGASLSWNPVCGGGCGAGPAGAVGAEGAVLASGEGGRFTVDAPVTLRLPAYTRPGAYRATLTLTLS
ncbi:beta-xylosidase [Streptomyces sp. NPDC001594]|uniref:beta-xylosidase n=1 Tax=Streptomyces sp. NPDC001594 TaxID=3364590 RepID=UPI0036A492F6